MGAVIETAAVAATGAATETVMVAATGAAAGTTTMDTTGTATGTGTEAAAETVTVAATGTSTETAIGAAGDCRPSPAFLSLRNPDYVFWIRIPGTSVDYPVVKERIDGYYLNHTFEEKENPGGCLFVSDSFKSLEMDHTILYGHNMKDGSMFSDLKKYVDREFLDSHPDIFLHDGLEWRQYRIFSCQIREESDTEVYVQSMEKAEWSSYLDEMVRRSLHKTDLRPVETDRIITLSTCYGSRKRMIVQAVLLCYTE